MFSAAEAAHVPDVDPERRRWLERLARACRTVLARDGDRSDPHYAALLEDVAELLARVEAELAAAGTRS